MTLSELKSQINDLHDKFESDIRSLKRHYCWLNKRYNIGDKFTDHIGSIIVEEIRYHYSSEPCCVYYGTELKKDGTPRKDGSKRQAWQSNEKK